MVKINTHSYAVAFRTSGHRRSSCGAINGVRLHMIEVCPRHIRVIAARNHVNARDCFSQELYRVLKQGGQFLVFDVRRDSSRMVYWIIRFAQAFILPKSLKRINEPTGFFLAAYTRKEAEGILRNTLLKQWKVKSGLFWLFIWGQKGVTG